MWLKILNSFFGANPKVSIAKGIESKPPREKRRLGTSSNNAHSDFNLPHNTPSGNKAFDTPHLIKNVWKHHHNQHHAVSQSMITIY